MEKLPQDRQVRPLPLFPVFPRCLDCLDNLAVNATRMASSDPETRAAAEKAARSVINSSGDLDLSSPETANDMLKKIREITGVEDPYLDYKTREMQKAEETFRHVSKGLDVDFSTALALAAFGNSLDFFQSAEDVFQDRTGQVLADFRFYHNDEARLSHFLSTRPRQILYFTDNAGEVFFDLPLYEHLRQKAEKVVLVVKGGPGLNDLTRRELESRGLMDRFDEVADTGTDGAGIDWRMVSDRFLELVNQADLIVSKGMANFETVYNSALPCPVFFLFKVKCAPIKDYLSAPPDTFWALWKEAGKVSGG